MPNVTLTSIQAARARIGEAIYVSPCQLSHDLSELTGLPLHLKLENLQRTGSFKERGALNKLLTLNRGRAQARRHRRQRRQSRAGSRLPRRGPRHSRADRHAAGHAADQGRRHARASAQRSFFTAQATTKPAKRLCAAASKKAAPSSIPSTTRRSSAGQGTIGLELLEQVPDIEAVVVPIGGGGLIGGIACALKETNPKIRVIGVEPEKLPSMLRAREAGAPVTIAAEATIADGIAVRRAGDLTLPLVSRYVDEIVTVDDEEIASAILMLLEQEKTLAEGAGAAALAAVVQSKTNLRHRRTVVLVCGGNIDVTLLAKIIERGLVKDGRLLRMRVYLQDRPGALLQLTQILARERANIVETIHNRAYYGVSLGETVIDVTLETRGATHITAISHALREAGFRFERIQ